MNSGIIVAIVFACLIFIAFAILLFLLPIKLYFSALFSGAHISAFKLISLKMRKQKLAEIVEAFILAKKAKLGTTLFDLEIVATSGGHPKNVVEGLLAALNAKIDIDFDFACAVDIAGMDILQVVRECINPKVFELPLISGVAQDNIEVNVKVSLTMKVVVSNFLKGVSDETVSARAVEAVVTKIANTEKAGFLVANPQFIDKAIFQAEVDSDSKYHLVSADVVHIDLGIDRKVNIEREKIEKERMIVANQLEHRRLIAMAVEQEMRAKAEEMRAKVVANEAEVPKAVVEAIKEGKIKDVVDFYKLQNIQADTEMRRHFVGKKDDKE